MENSILRLLMWLMTATVGAILLEFLRRLTGCELRGETVAAKVVYSMGVILYGYFVLTAFSWAAGI